MTHVKAKVANVYESGTDCSVVLELHNPGTSETCSTGVMDDPGNSWGRNDIEAYHFEDNPVCTNFQPENNLQFKFHLDDSCIDHMQLIWVRVHFARKCFTWSGQHWWNPSSRWMYFDSMDDFGPGKCHTHV